MVKYGEFEFPADKGFTASNGAQVVRGYLRKAAGGRVCTPAPKAPVQPGKAR